MPHADDGFATAIMGLFIGVVVSALISSTLSSLGANQNLVILANILVSVLGIIQLERAKYWGISYIIGYFLGIAIIGQYLMESWDFSITILILSFYFIMKILRKSNIRL